MYAATNPNTPARISNTSQGHSGDECPTMTSSTIVFSISGVSAATTWPRIDTPNAMNTLRLCAMRNGHSRRNHPPASGGAGSGVARWRGSTARKSTLLQHRAQREKAMDHRVGVLLVADGQHFFEVG